MKRMLLTMSSLFLFCFIACDQVGDSYTGKENTPTELSYFNTEMAKFSSIEVNNEIDFMIGEADNVEAKISYPYQLGKTAVTRDLWSHVYQWATNEELAKREGRNLYKFSSKANVGKVEVKKTEPITNVTFMDAVVWCNALTEYLNFLHKDEKQWVELFPVYYRHNPEVQTAFEELVNAEEKDRRAKYLEKLKDMVLREAGEPTQSNNDGMRFKDFYEFNGYRLPTNVEWEFAARLTNSATGTYDSSKTVNLGSNTYYLLKGLCLSGSSYLHNDTSATGKATNALVATNFGKLADGDASHSEDPNAVATKRANVIGLFDMSGNVWEWILPYKERRIVLKKASGNKFILDGDYPYSNENGENRIKGGSYLSNRTIEYAVGFVGTFKMKADSKNKDKWQKKDIGFRLSKTDKNFF